MSRMKAGKRAKLEAAGWKVRSAADFLDLSDVESQLIDLKLALSDALTLLRESRKLTQLQLAGQLHTSQSRVAKMEGGDPAVSMELLLKAHLHLGSSPEYIASVIAPRKPIILPRIRSGATMRELSLAAAGSRLKKASPLMPPTRRMRSSPK